MVDEGQDPLGLQSMTQDRLMPRLLPGLLELLQVARYFSVHAFLLDEYRRRRLPATLPRSHGSSSPSSGTWVSAVRRCPCTVSPVGARKLSTIVDPAATLLPRGESVDSALGGYGLYYRSPMVTLGLVARAGSLLAGEPTPIDVLRPESPRAARLVAEFRAGVGDTAYVQRYLNTDDPIPVEVIDEFAALACLCRLVERPMERAAVHDAMFGTDPGVDTESQAKGSVCSGAAPWRTSSPSLMPSRTWPCPSRRTGERPDAPPDSSARYTNRSRASGPG